MANPAYGSFVGPGSTFRCVAYALSATDQGNGTYKVVVRYYVEVSAGTNGFGGTQTYASWYGGGSSMFQMYGSGNYAVTDITYTQNYGSNMSIGFSAWYNRTNGTQYKSSATFTYTVPTPSYYLDVNGYLDGESVGNVSGYGTFNVAINGTTASSGITDYYTAHPYGTKYSISGVSATTGHTYNGVYSGSASGTITKATSVYLNFTTNSYSITYNNNGGSGSVSSQSFKHGKSVTISAGTALSKTGHTFNGWNTNAAGTGTNYTVGTAYTPNQNLTLYAKWKANTYTINYDANGGTGAPSSQTKTYGVNLILQEGTPTRTGYLFKYWTTEKNGGGTGYYPKGTYSIDSGVTLYAQWEIIKNSITYDGNADNATNVPNWVNKNYGDSITIAAGPTRPGYKFTGWNTAMDGKGTSYAAGATYSKNENLILYAQWQLITLITLSPSVGTTKYTISATSTGKANLTNLSIPFIINTVSDNENLLYYYKIYYKVGTSKIQIGNSSYGAVTPVSVSKKGNFEFTKEMIEQYIKATNNTSNLVFYIETYTAEINSVMQASDITVTIPINNYTRPTIQLTSAERLQDGRAMVQVRVKYPASYSINTTNIYPSIALDGVILTSQKPTSVVNEGNNQYLYTYLLTASESFGSRTLTVSYNDNIYLVSDNDRLSANYDDQIIKILRSGALSAVEFIESDGDFKFSKDGKVYASIFSEVF